MYEHINESKLNPEARMGLAYCRMNCWEWDDYMSNKPEGFEESNKFEILKQPMKEIENIIGVNNCNKYLWLFQLGKTEAEWAQWYYVDRYKE